MNSMKKKYNQDAVSPLTKFQYSKSSEFYKDTKKLFFSENEYLFKKQLKFNEIYSSQKLRDNCKICDSRLPNKIDLESHGISYVFCQECNHLNGKFEDTEEFHEKMYTLDKGDEYAELYIDENYMQRTKDIYIPKVDFLINNIPSRDLRILDIGCGSGYFVFASLLRKLSAVGVDVSSAMINFGNHQISQALNRQPLDLLNGESDLYDKIIYSEADVISAIFVIEHLRNPHKLFEAFKKSKAKYFYYSLPMFSFSVIIENCIKNVFPRHLSGGHTHLFTEASIIKMNQLIGAYPIAEWRFGSDIMDLYRHLLINLNINESSQKIKDLFDEGFGKKINEIQSVLDKNHFCSEIHVVAAKI